MPWLLSTFQTCTRGMDKYPAYAVILTVLGAFTAYAGYRRDIRWKYGFLICWKHRDLVIIQPISAQYQGALFDFIIFMAFNNTDYMNSNKRKKMRRSWLIEQVKTTIKVRHYNRKTEKAYCYWIRFFIRFHRCGTQQKCRNHRLPNPSAFCLSTRKFLPLPKIKLSTRCFFYASNSNGVNVSQWFFVQPMGSE